jgi:hypothetical protein
VVALTEMGLKSAEFQLGRLHEKHAVATWRLGNCLGICLKAEEDLGNLCRDSRSQDLPVAY